MGLRQGAWRDLAMNRKGEQECYDPSAHKAGKYFQHSLISEESGVHQLPCVPGWLSFQL
jgi:hypothetical protein